MRPVRSPAGDRRPARSRSSTGRFLAMLGPFALIRASMHPCGARGAFAAGSRRSFRVVPWLSDHSPPQSSDRLLPRGARAFSSRWLTGRQYPNETRSVSPRLAHGPSVPGWRTGRQCPDRLALRPLVPLVHTGRQAPLAHGPSVPLLVVGPSVPAALGPSVPGVGYGRSLSLVPSPSP